MSRYAISVKIGAASAAALSLAPAIGAAAPVYVIDRPVTISFEALGGGFGSVGVPWDIDGVNGADTHFSVRRQAYGTYYRSYTAGGSEKVQNVVGNLDFPGLYGIGPVVFARMNGRSELVFVQESAVVGPTIGAAYAFQPPPFNGISTVARLVTPPGGTPETVSQHAFATQTPYGYAFGVQLMPFGFDVGGQQHVGWARIRFNGAPDAQLVIERWAYESEPNTAIHVDSIPAPPAGVAALSLLAMGAAGLRSHRKRKQMQAAG